MVTGGRGSLTVNEVWKEACMTRIAHRPEELSGAERAAWESYRERLGDLHGREYEEAEPASWEELQRTLRELAEREVAPA